MIVEARNHRRYENANGDLGRTQSLYRLQADAEEGMPAAPDVALALRPAS